MSRLVELLGSVSRYELERRPACELGVVTSVFDSGDDAQSVSVTLKDSGLSLNRIPVAVPVTGLAGLPRVGDVVLVLFPRGDLGSGVVAGQVYSDARRPPPFGSDEVVLQWPGDAADPDVDAVRVSIKAANGDRTYTVELGGDRDAAITVSDGSIELTSGEVTFRLGHSSASDGTATLTAGGTKIELQQDGDLTAEAVGTLTLKGAKVAIEASGQVTIKGATVELN